MLRDITHFTQSEFLWTIQRLFPLPENMGPFPKPFYNGELFKLYPIKFPLLLADNLIDVNPMKGPESTIYYLDIIHSSKSKNKHFQLSK